MESITNIQEKTKAEKKLTILYIEDNQANIRPVEGLLKCRLEISLVIDSVLELTGKRE